MARDLPYGIGVRADGSVVLHDRTWRPIMERAPHSACAHASVPGDRLGDVVTTARYYGPGTDYPLPPWRSAETEARLRWVLDAFRRATVHGPLLGLLLPPGDRP